MAQFKETGSRLSNWGRWGEDDQLGALNLMTPERIVAAARLVRTGKTFALGIGVDHQHGVQSMPNFMQRINPVHLMSHLPGDLDLGSGTVVSDDWIFMPTHGSTHWDAFAHTGYDNQFYNGIATSAVKANSGAARLGIDTIAERGIVGRGVLLDVARTQGLDYLPASFGIGPSELEAAEERQGVTVGEGDVLLVRTGWWEFFVAEGDVRAFRAGAPGLTPACADWLAERDIPVVACDNWSVEVMPSQTPDTMIPLHCILLRDMGVLLGENLALGELATDCEADGVWEFLFCSSPLKIVNGVGSPANPLAIK